MQHRRDEADVFWDEEAGVIIKWSLFWINIALKEYDPEYTDIVLDGDDGYSVTAMLEWIIESDWSSWFSEPTLKFFGELVFFIAEEEFEKAKEAEEAWESERWSHFWDNFRIFDWLNFGIDASFFFFFMKPWAGVEAYF